MGYFPSSIKTGNARLATEISLQNTKFQKSRCSAKVIISQKKGKQKVRRGCSYRTMVFIPSLMVDMVLFRRIGTV